MAKVMCEYCGRTIQTTNEKCPFCGKPNTFYRKTSNKNKTNRNFTRNNNFKENINSYKIEINKIKNTQLTPEEIETQKQLKDLFKKIKPIIIIFIIFSVISSFFPLVTILLVSILEAFVL